MCRQYLLLGSVLIALGAGLLIGNWAGGGFLFHCFGFAMVLGGLLLLRKR